MTRFSTNDKILEEYSKHKVYCKKCGHPVLFLPFENKEKKICSWCGHYIYLNEKIEFKEKLKKVMGNGRNL